MENAIYFLEFCRENEDISEGVWQSSHLLQTLKVTGRDESAGSSSVGLVPRMGVYKKHRSPNTASGKVVSRKDSLNRNLEEQQSPSGECHRDGLQGRAGTRQLKKSLKHQKKGLFFLKK